MFLKGRRELVKKIIASVFAIGLFAMSNHLTYAASYAMHTVQNGESLWQISKSYNKSIEYLEQLNPEFKDVIYTGDKVKVGIVGNGTSIKITVNDKNVPLEQDAYIEDGRTFVPIRFVAEALGAQVDWNQSTQTVGINYNNNNISMIINSNTATINNKTSTLDLAPSLYADRAYVPIRFIAETLNCSVSWNGSSSTIKIDTTKKYSSDDIYWLSRIVNAEAGGESANGKLAVANVILNRVKSNEFPKTIKEVIFDKNYGYQFTPVMNGTIYNNPSTESINAAISALNGNNNIGSALYFLNPSKSTSTWILKNRTYYTTIGLHKFYL